MKILLFGKNGQLGSELFQCLNGQHHLVALGREDIDLRKSNDVKELLPLIPSVDLLVNAAAYTHVDAAESNARTAIEVNTFAPELLAFEAKRRRIPLLHFSTDYVFDGHHRNMPYEESDAPRPCNVYGQTKLGGEIAIRETWDRHWIFRLSAVYGGATGFIPSMFSKAISGQTPNVVADQIISPNYSRDIAAVVTAIIGQYQNGSGGQWGTYHLSGEGSVRWYDFAVHLFERCEGRSRPVPVSSREYGAAAERPAYSVLDSRKTERTFGIKLPHWKEQFNHYWERT